MLQLVRYSEEARALSSRMAAISERREKDKTSATLLPTIAEELKEKDQGKIDTDTIVQQAGIAVEEATLLMDEQDCLRQSQSLFNGLATSLAYAPLTVHWQVSFLSLRSLRAHRLITCTPECSLGHSREVSLATSYGAQSSDL